MQIYINLLTFFLNWTWYKFSLMKEVKKLSKESQKRGWRDEKCYTDWPNCLKEWKTNKKKTQKERVKSTTVMLILGVYDKQLVR